MAKKTPFLSCAAVAACAILAGCAQKPPPVAEVPSETATQKPDTWGPQSPQPAWWADAKPCPEGAKLVGAVPPKGTVVQCRLPSGATHGFESVWFPNGHEGTLTEYDNGMRHGRWLHWLHGRKMIEGEHRLGRRHGTWSYWFDELSDFDTQSRLQPNLPLLVERYNNGMLLKSERHGSGSPEKLTPEPPHPDGASAPTATSEPTLE